MKILVTGAAGTVGAFVARELLNHGYEVRLLDRAAPPEDLRERAEIVYANLSDRLAMLRAAQNCDAIAHLAAIPNPMHGQDLEIFEPNVLGTQYVLAAAEAQGISKVVLASSVSIYGVPFAKKPFVYERLPISEDHPITEQDLYALSKHFNELTAATYTRRTGMATTCLRLGMVVDFAGDHKHWYKRSINNLSDWPSRDFWHFIEVRDAARAFRLALENVREGHHAAHVVAREPFSKHPPRELIRIHYPHLERFLDSDWDFARMGFWDTRRAEA
ncbi:MAG TPA: NAD(P)-dependent oxidoreductase, partial [Abditibacterium sp.]